MRRDEQRYAGPFEGVAALVRRWIETVQPGADRIGWTVESKSSKSFVVLDAEDSVEICAAKMRRAFGPAPEHEHTSRLARAVDAIAERYALTKRRREVAREAAYGLTNEEIAKVLGISKHTVKAHIKAVYERTGCANRHELFRLVYDVVAEHHGRAATSG